VSAFCLDNDLEGTSRFCLDVRLEGASDFCLLTPLRSVDLRVSRFVATLSPAARHTNRHIGCHLVSLNDNRRGHCILEDECFQNGVTIAHGAVVAA